MVPRVHLWMMSSVYVEGVTAGWSRLSDAVLCDSVVPALLKRDGAGTGKNQPVLSLGRKHQRDKS